MSLRLDVRLPRLSFVLLYRLQLLVSEKHEMARVNSRGESRGVLGWGHAAGVLLTFSVSFWGKKSVIFLGCEGVEWKFRRAATGWICCKAMKGRSPRVFGVARRLQGLRSWAGTLLAAIDPPADAVTVIIGMKGLCVCQTRARVRCVSVSGSD
jgi:hypothetical protein